MTYETINRCPLSEKPIYTAWTWSDLRGEWLWGGEWQNMQDAAERADRWVESVVNDKGESPDRIVVIFPASEFRNVGKTLAAETVNAWRKCCGPHLTASRSINGGNGEEIADLLWKNEREMK